MSAPAPEKTIEVQNLVKSYAGFTAVNGLSFEVRRGEIVGFLGPNGAGKSTTMRILSGFLPATSGHVSVCGVPVASRPGDAKKFLGYMPENNPLPEDVRVAEYLHFRGRLKELSGRRLRDRIDTVVEQCDLKRVRHRIIGTLSKGTKQRVGIAEAVLAEPAVLIMDEPTIGLDPHQILMIRDLIAGLRGRMSVILSSHILPEIEMSCDRVLIINQGRIVASGSPTELRREFLGPNTWRLEAAGDPARLAAALRGVAPTARAEPAVAPAPIDPSAPPPVSVPAPDEFVVWRVAGLEDAQADRALAACVEAGVRVRSFARAEASLEEVFLAATRRSWDVTLDAAKRGGKAPPAGGG